MARLMDLPDEILEIIFNYFKITSQRSPYLRRFNETDEGDASKRAELAALVRVCKRFSSLTSPLLHQNGYLHLDMATANVYLTARNLALLSDCRKLHHLVCLLDLENTKSFLVCLANAAIATTLRSLSVTIDGIAMGQMNLRRLRDLPTLMAVQIRFHGECSELELIMPSPASLSLLKELHIWWAETFAQTVDILSLASSTALEILDMECCIVESPPGSLNLWRQSLGHRGLPRVYNLTITLHPTQRFPVELLQEVPTHFPSLKTFHLACGRLATKENEKLLSSHAHTATSHSMEPYTTPDLRCFLSLVKRYSKPHPTLQTIHIRLEHYFSSKAVHTPNTIQLSKDARKAASSAGIALKPENLSEILEEWTRYEAREEEDENDNDDDDDDDE